MFEPVNDLAKHLPRPNWTGDPVNDMRVAEQHIANGRVLRSEAFRCLGRGLLAGIQGGMHRVIGPIGATPSYPV